MFKIIIAIAAIVTPLSMSQAQNMPLDQFLAKATAVEKKGAMAVFSSDVRLLKKEMAASAEYLRTERLATQSGGRKPAYCPPAKQSLNNVEILTHFRAIPAAQRNVMRTKDAFRSLLAKKYPCTT